MEINKETPVRVKKRECIKKIREILTRIGPWNINVKLLSEEFHLDWHTVDNLFKNILRHMPETTANDLRIKFEDSFQKAIKHCELKLADPTIDDDTKDKAIKNIVSLNMSYTKFLEEWNRKEKVAEKTKIEITTEQEDKLLEEEKKMILALPKESQEAVIKILRRKYDDQ